MYKKVQTNQVKLLIKSLNYWSPKTIKKVLGNKFHVVPNYAISGQLGLERCDGALSQKIAVSKSPNNISDKDRRCVVSTTEPHLAYDCSALALIYR